MKQRIVIQVQMSGDRSRSKALGLVASTHGVQSVAIEGRERNHLVVVGDGLDAVSLTSYLRKKVGAAQIVHVEVVGGGGDKTKPPAMATTASSSVLAAGSQQWQPRYYHSGYYSRPAAVHPYGAADEKTMPQATATTATSVLAAGSQHWQPRYYSRPAAVHPYAAGQYGHDHDETPRYDADSSCAIM